ncbi:fluoride efflux transporter CrcB [Parasulfitobacter algicola]|uniref:Fluoride-specific ion channel FluC n=1 Tax=Parasulfitobacter algicola TaxID=2614809 RepID=A0ABX2IUM9_9RHOB|nr:fluoride efflux transporter CrcB [Sulfitobacter algicola]NSX56015.1 fluoride efflux transporter CrcB [Sulfitobacter algicola]
MFITVLQVAAGGAIGATGRYLTGALMIRILGPGFPWTTMVVNILGSFLMGAFIIYAAERSATHLNPFIMTGVLGGFTTFSAFSLDAVTLFERGQMTAAAGYVIGSVVLSLAALFAGMAAAKGIFA